MDTVIIARYNEDITWSKGLNTFIVQKDEHLPNKGMETSSYFWYIIENYNSLKGVYKFRQGNIKDHKIGVFDHECDLDGSPHHPGLPIREIANKIGLKLPNTLQFTAGAMFDVTAKQIKERDLDWYKNAYKVSIEHPQAPWVFERLWKYIFNL
jgi:hypothetical protein